MQPLKNLSYKEKRQKLITEITEKASGALSNAEVISIVNQLNINLPYQMKRTHSYEEMRKQLILKQFSPDNLRAYPKEYGSILLGKASFGLLENGLLVAPPILEEGQKLVILIDQHRFCSYNGICTKLGKTLKIIMYIP